MRYFVDLHIHTGLSPCASDDMTPNNIVNMALLKGLHFIAVTDHNTTGNVASVINCARNKSIIVIPGMEIESAEEVHLICLFPTVKAANHMEKIVGNNLPFYKNRPEIFGEQILYDEKDNIIGYKDNLLLTATTLTVDTIKREVESLGGIVFPSHVDRSSYSIISNLGFIPEDLHFSTIETSQSITKKDFFAKFPDMRGYKAISNSDAHELGQISEAKEWVHLKEYSTACLLDYLTQKNI